MKVEYKIQIKKSAAKEIKKLPDSYLKKVLEKINSLKNNPRPKGCKKLSVENAYRVRVGAYRIVYKVEDDKLIVLVIRVAHRKDVYN